MLLRTELKTRTRRCAALETLTVALGLVAATMHGTGYLIYNRQAKRGTSKPNIVSWTIFALLAIINVFNYATMTGDMVATSQFIIGTFACLCTFGHVVLKGRFYKPGLADWLVFTLCLSAIAVWRACESPTYANQIVAAAYALSLSLTLFGVRRDKSRETPLAWWVWASSFVVTLVNLSLRGKAQLHNLTTPATMLVLDILIALSCSGKDRANVHDPSQ